MTTTEPSLPSAGDRADPPAPPEGTEGSAPASGQPRLTYLAGLDGLRGLAALGVVAFHARMSWMTGGFLAVTTFFALSGFLLTSLLVAEHRSSGTIRTGAFWARRFRRLLPAAVVTLAVVAALGPLLGSPEQLHDLRGDTLSALFYVANWHLVLDGRAYTDLFAAPSPLQHFWTLSVEEQFFLVLPVIVLGVVVWNRRASGPGTSTVWLHDTFRRRLGVVMAAATVASAVWLWSAYDPASGSIAAYYGTGTRAAEFLIGGLAAVVLGRPDAVLPASLRRVLPIAGPIALVALIATWVTTTDGSAWLYHLGFPGVALLSVVVLVSAIGPGPLRTVLGAAPLREVGKRSYGLYLFHWPVFVWLTEDVVGVAGTALLAVQLAVISVLTWASFRWIEQPVRLRRRITTRRQVTTALPVAVATVAVVAVAATWNPPAADLVFDRLEDPDEVAVAPPPGPEAPPPPRRVLVVGDSMANNLAQGLARIEDDRLVVWDRSTPGCGVSEDERLVATTGWQAPDARCTPSWRTQWVDEVAAIEPDVVVVLVGAQEVWDRRRDGEVIPFDSPEGAEVALGELRDAVTLLSRDGATVVLVTLPVSDWSNWGLVLADEERSINNPAWVARWNELVRQVAAENPDTVVLADMAELLTPEGAFTETKDGVEVRADDGLHLTLEGQDLTAAWLVDLLLEGVASG